MYVYLGATSDGTAVLHLLLGDLALLEKVQHLSDGGLGLLTAEGDHGSQLGESSGNVTR